VTMNILLVTPVFAPSSFGGVKTHVTDLSRALSKRGHAVTVYTSNAYNSKTNLDIKGETKLGQVRVIYFENRFPRKYWFTPSLAPFMRKEIEGFDIVHLHHHFTFQNIVAHHYARRCEVPFVFSAHGAAIRIMRSHLKKLVYDILFGNSIIANASKLIAVAPKEKAHYMKRGVPANKIEIIPHALHLDAFELLPDKNTFREEHGIRRNDRVILFLGRLHEIKGLDLLLCSFRRLVEHFRNIKLVIVGPDFGYRAKVTELIERMNLNSSVVLTGGLFGRDKLQAYAAADIFVLPSRYEVFGIAALEASACAIPVVITNRCGYADLIQGEAGIVIPCSESHLTEALRELLTDRQERVELGSQGKRLVKERHSWAVAVEQIEAVYADAIRRETKV